MRVIGMAKSNFDLKGVKSIKIELDFLRIVYFVKSKEEIKKGYLMVTTEKIKKRVESWKKKYGVDNEIEIIVAKLTAEEKRLLEKEKIDNLQGMVEGVQTDKMSGKSIAKLGKKLIEHKLKVEIEERECPITVLRPKLFEINWDYCGEKYDSN